MELALKQLDANREEVEINIVSRGKTGIFGIGAEPARVRVTRLAEPKTSLTISQEVLDKLLSAMGVSAVSHIAAVQNDERGGPLFDIEGEDSALLIGRRGETLRSLQYLVNLIVSRRLDGFTKISIDVEGYRERRYKALRTLAIRVAERVEATGQSITLEPMPSNERREVHLALESHPKVTTQSAGQGDGRKVTIQLK
ncbi:MAG: protein jag [Chloroflexi bacterium]|nr:protein jag [Chloroflexota bacterium]